MTDTIKRRAVLRNGATLAAATTLALNTGGATAMAQRPGVFTEYRRHDAIGLADLVARGDASPAQLLDIAISRCEQVNPAINAVVARHFDLARQAVRKGLPDGALKGVPFLLKDLGIALEGTVTTHGSRFYKDARYNYDSTVVTRYKQAGLVIFGKTHSPEFGSTASSESVLFGETHNPWDLSRSAGGSSGGSAAAIAAGIVPVAHASDGGGSIRIPASACGLFGLKPTRGRVPLGPEVYEGRNGLSAQHVISRSVRDSALLLDITGGGELGDAYAAPQRERPYMQEVALPPGQLRIALMTRPILPVPVSPKCIAATEQAARLCESLGHIVEAATPSLPLEPLFNALAISSNVVVAEKVRDREQWLSRKVTENDIEKVNWHSLQEARKYSALDYSLARRTLHAASRQMARFMINYDVILSPTMAILPPPLGALSLEQPFETFMQPASGASAYTSLYNMTGQPAMSVPLHWTEDGIPVGVMFAGRFGDEATLFRLAAQLERAAPWFDRLPDIGS